MMQKAINDKIEKTVRACANMGDDWSPCGVLFDFDGTLTRPGILDFAAIRKKIACPENETILEYIRALPHGTRRERCVTILDAYEKDAAARAEPNAGAEDLVLHLKARHVVIGIITRNRLSSVIRSLRNFSSVQTSYFSAIITRDDPVRPKPEPDGVLLAATRMSVPAERLLVVGDYIFDVEAGKRAGAKTAFLSNGTNGRSDPGSDFPVAMLSELKSLC